MDRSITAGRANLLGIALLPPILLCSLGPFTLLWGLWPLWEGLRSPLPPIIFPVAVVAGVVCHECLHAAGFVWKGGVSLNDIELGFNLRALAPYVHATVPMRTDAYRLALVAPMTVLGIAPSALAWAFGSPLLAWYGFLMIAVSAGDLIILWLVRKESPGTLVVDHPTRPGCTVVSGDPEGGTEAPDTLMPRVAA